MRMFCSLSFAQPNLFLLARTKRNDNQHVATQSRASHMRVARYSLALLHEPVMRLVCAHSCAKGCEKKPPLVKSASTTPHIRQCRGEGATHCWGRTRCPWQHWAVGTRGPPGARSSSGPAPCRWGGAACGRPPGGTTPPWERGPPAEGTTTRGTRRLQPQRVRTVNPERSTSPLRALWWH